MVRIARIEASLDKMAYLNPPGIGVIWLIDDGGDLPGFLGDLCVTGGPERVPSESTER
jgi:hypothetical protein